MVRRLRLDACRAAIGAFVLFSASAPNDGAAQPIEQDATPFKSRHIDVSRESATKLPRTEADQALVDGWPLYRTERGQAAFNDAMATLKATEGPVPSAQTFKGCAQLECHLALPALGPDGWIAPGRIWVSPAEYVLVVHSPRLADGQSYRRRGARGMRIFVFHEFHNSSHNTDVYDTISSHKGSVFVPFYMSKPATDAKGRRFVIVLQVAPHDVVGIHATNRGSAGPGMEAARNTSDPIEPLQNLAGIVIATVIKTAAPKLQVVNHRNSEGLPMLEAYERRLAKLEARSAGPVASAPAPGKQAKTLVLPFVAAPAHRVAAAAGKLEDLIGRRGSEPPIAAVQARTSAALLPEPKLIGPIRLATRPAPSAGSGAGK